MSALLLALLLPALAGAPDREGVPEWWERPVAAPLEPVGPAYVHRYFVFLDHRLAGWRAAGSFRRPVARARAHFALQAWGVEPLPLEDQAQEEMLVVLGAAMGLAADDMVREVVYRSEELGAAHDAVRAVVSPGLLVQKREDGTRVTAVPPVGGHQLEARARAREELERTHPRLRPRHPTFRLGTGLMVRGLDEDEALPLVDAAVFASGSWLGPLDGWRVSGLLLSQQWTASMREQVSPGHHLTMGLRSVRRSVEPGAVTVSWNVHLGRYGIRGWTARTWWTHTLPWAEIREERVMVELRRNTRWRTAQPPRGWVLGNRLDRAGLPLPGGNPGGGELRWLVEPDPVTAVVRSAGPPPGAERDR